MKLGTSTFKTYTALMRKVYSAESLQRQINAARKAQFRASLVGSPETERQVNLLPHIQHFRQRNLAKSS